MPLTGDVGASWYAVCEDDSWPKENCLGAREGACDLLLDAARCLFRLTERAPVVWGRPRSEVPGAVPVFGLKVALHLKAQHATARDQDDEVRLAFHLADVLSEMQRMQHGPVGRAAGESLEYEDLTWACAGWVVGWYQMSHSSLIRAGIMR